MKRQIFQITSWTIAAIISIAGFSFLKIKTGAHKESDIAENVRTDKIDSAVLPESVGENTLAENNFFISEEEYFLRLNFLDKENLEISESLSVDGYFTMEVNWAAEYSLNSSTGQLYIKRCALIDGDNKISSSLKISEILKNRMVENLIDAMDSISYDVDADWKDLVQDRADVYVDSLLFEIKTYEIERIGVGAIFEETKNFSPRLNFSSADFEGSVSIKNSVIFINANFDDGDRFFGGVIFSDGQNQTAEMYEFLRQKGTRHVTLNKIGKLDFSIEEGTVVSDSQTVECKMKIIHAPEKFSFPFAKEFTAQKLLCPSLLWLTTNQNQEETYGAAD